MAGNTPAGNKRPAHPASDPFGIIMGMILLGLGIFLVFQNTYVTTDWGWYRIGGFQLPSGTIVLPLLAGIGMLFYNSKSVAAWVVTGIGVLAVLVTMLISVRLRFAPTSLFNYILMFGCIGAGLGLITRYAAARRRVNHRD